MLIQFQAVMAFCVTSLAVFLAGCETQRPQQTPAVSGGSTTPGPIARPATGETQSSGKSPSPTTSKPGTSTPAESPPNPRPAFVDVARELGVSVTQFNDAQPDRLLLPEVMGCGAAWADFDLDGHLDLFLSNGCPLDPKSVPRPQHHTRLLYGTPGQPFREVSEPSHANIIGYGQGVAVGDFDTDGFPDLYLANYGPNRLLHNNGDGTFSDVTAQANVADPRWSSSATWFDVDGDGDLDLYVVNYMDVTFQNHKICEYLGKPGYCGPGSYEAVPDAVYVNDGQGGFQDRAAELGLTAENGKGLAIIVADLNDDRLADIYVANDMTPNFLFTRNADMGTQASAVRYREIAQAAGCATSGTGMNEAGMGVACADFDADGRLDLFLTHYYHAKNTLYRNLGNMLFDDDSRRTRIAAVSRESLGFGNVAFDFDRDGDTDLCVANGHVLGPFQQPNEMLPQLLANSDGLFSDVSSFAGPYFSQKVLGRCVAAADFDDDGDLDLGVTHLDRPFALLRNDTPTRRDWLGIELQTRSRIPAVGGQLIVQRGSLRMIQPIAAGGSYLATGDARLLFGLGSGQEPVDVEIRWPNGRTDQLRNVELNRYLRVVLAD